MTIYGITKDEQVEMLNLKIANGYESHISIVFLKNGDIWNVWLYQHVDSNLLISL